MLRISNLAFEAGPQRYNDISMQLADGEYATLMGHTGAGKSTMLEVICGLHPALSGQVVLDDVDLTGLPPGDRSIGYVPQDLALFSTMSVLENLAFGLRLRRKSSEFVTRRVREVADLLRIEQVLDCLPATLSGGEARRVAIGRALCISPRLLLLDEPLSGIDDDTKRDVYAAIETIHQSSNAAVIHVTHDYRDAERLANRLFVLREGELSEGVLHREGNWSTARGPASK